jgi:hypothetical protein
MRSERPNRFGAEQWKYHEPCPRSGRRGQFCSSRWPRLLRHPHRLKVLPVLTIAVVPFRASSCFLEREGYAGVAAFARWKDIRDHGWAAGAGCRVG